MTDLAETTWAMKSLFASGWIAIDAGQAVDALECGVPVKLMTFAELLGYVRSTPLSIPQEAWDEATKDAVQG